MQLANSCSHTILNARLHCVNFENFAPYFLYHYCLHYIVLHVQHLNCSLIRQGCCETANFDYTIKQMCLQMQNATIPPWYSHLVIRHFLAWQSGFAPLRTVHSLMLSTMPMVPHLRLNYCIQRYSTCLPAILAPNLRHFSSIYLGLLENLYVCGLFYHT